ncbi:hypothetical protein BT69DRAFT_1346360 [Atractiella rhizophila]|nr:hypothetical protein BT69DRAFT_1346360 [Atractiella rhizophila]
MDTAHLHTSTISIAPEGVYVYPASSAGRIQLLTWDNLKAFFLDPSSTEALPDGDIVKRTAEILREMETQNQDGRIILLTFAVAFLYKWWILLQWSLIRITENANIAGPPVGAVAPPPVIIAEKVHVEPLHQEKSSSVTRPAAPPVDAIILNCLTLRELSRNKISNLIPLTPPLIGSLTLGFRGFKPLRRNLVLVTLKFARLMLITIVLPHAIRRAIVSIKAKWILAPPRAVSWIPATVFALVFPSNPTPLETEHSTLFPFICK